MVLQPVGFSAQLPVVPKAKQSMVQWLASGDSFVRFKGRKPTVKIHGTGPIPNSVVRRIALEEAQEWGIPIQAIPTFKWMAGTRTATLSESHVVTLGKKRDDEFVSRGSHVKDIIHELGHSFRAVYIASIPKEDLYQYVVEGYASGIRQGEFRGVIDTIESDSQEQPFLPMTQVQRHMFAALFLEVLAPERRQFDEDSGRPSLPATVEDLLKLNPIIALKPSGTGMSDDAYDDTMTNLFLSLATHCIVAVWRLEEGKRLEKIRAILAKHPLKRRKFFRNQDLVKQHELALERNMNDDDDGVDDDDTLLHLMYRFDPEEVFCQAQEERVFLKLAHRVNALKAEGLLVLDKGTQQTFTRELRQAKRRIRILQQGRDTLRRTTALHRLSSVLKPLSHRNKVAIAEENRSLMMLFSYGHPNTRHAMVRRERNRLNNQPSLLLEELRKIDQDDKTDVATKKEQKRLYRRVSQLIAEEAMDRLRLYQLIQAVELAEETEQTVRTRVVKRAPKAKA